MTRSSGCGCQNVDGTAAAECGCLACATARAQGVRAVPLPGDDPFASPEPWADGWSCFRDLREHVQALAAAGVDYWDDGWRANALDVANPDHFDPWSPANDLANSALWLNSAFRFGSAGPAHSPTRRGSPGSDRLCVAVSTDMQTWLKTGQVIMDGASVPSVGVEVDEAGQYVLYVYFNCATYQQDSSGRLYTENGEPKADLHLSVAYTTDLLNWTYRHLTGRGAPKPPDFTGVSTDFDVKEPLAPWWKTDHPADPALVARPTGGWLLLVSLSRFSRGTEDAPNKPLSTFALQTTSLSSFDWWVVNQAQPLFPVPERGTIVDTAAAMDPSGYRQADRLHYHASRSNLENWSAEFRVDETNPAGDTFRLLSHGAAADTWSGNLAGTAVANVPTKLSNPTAYTPHRPFPARNPALDYFAFGQPSGGALRFILQLPVRTTTGEVSFRAPVLLLPDRMFEGEYVMDAAVTKFKDCYVMVYTAQLVPR